MVLCSLGNFDAYSAFTHFRGAPHTVTQYPNALTHRCVPCSPKWHKIYFFFQRKRRIYRCQDLVKQCFSCKFHRRW